MTTPNPEALAAGIACTGTKADGSRCRTTLGVSPVTRLCAFHDPERREQMHERRASGGRAAGASQREARAERKRRGRVPRAPKTLEDAVQWSSWAMHGVATGELDARSGHEIGYLVNAFKAAVEKRDLEIEIKKLRETIASLNKQPRGVA